MNLNLTIRRQWWIWVFVLFILLTALSVILTIRAIIQDYPPYRLSGHLTEVPLEQRAALVLGAKTKDNVMSNALRARVDYAIELYHTGQVGAVIFTGGFRDKDPAREQSESALARDYAVQRGVPTQRIWIEQRSTTTLENLREAQAIVNAQGFAQVALVSDRWHLARAQAMARDLDLPVVPAPTPYSVYRSPWHQAKFIWRELWTRWAYAVLGI